MCQEGVLGDEKHFLFECPALQDLRDRYEDLFQAPQGDAMILFMWQDDIIGVARFIDACLERVYTSAGRALPWGTRHLISPELAEKDVLILLLLEHLASIELATSNTSDVTAKYTWLVYTGIHRLITEIGATLRCRVPKR